ncbi:ABC transporter permease subunit [Plantactinospora sp. S1510]|uniref:ABC transporter permease subunit n=1 Tax=Plantactinospora alkalitolerans TaxID=2789879 RepID=A0ABS0H1Z9_9ACTN|nr:ABC transporter permease subunit [Plantactinospora alkalitolerans]MBF9132460.1 ABC transporter permease subunit [Plantactinospora alkalitolerans]
MTATTTPSGAGFAGLLRAEWTKLRSVRRWALTMLAAIALTVLISLLSAASSSFQTMGGSAPPIGPDGVQVQDTFRFVHQPMTGNGEVTARVLEQSGVEGVIAGWAKAGIMIKDGARPGARYAAMLLTPGHGVRWQTNFVVDRAGSAGGTAPVWLRLTRTGDTLTGYESTDGTNWRQVGSAELSGLPETAEVGIFVASPNFVRVERQFSGTSVSATPTWSTARFDNVGVRPAGAPSAAQWRDEEIGVIGLGGPDAAGGPAAPEGPGAPDTPDLPDAARVSGVPDSTGASTVTGTGDVAPRAPDEDLTRMSLSGVLIGLMPIVALGALFVTAEYRRGMIRTTFAASPRRGRVLAAKSLVLGAATFVAGLVACVTAFLASQPGQRASGYKPPYFPSQSLLDWPVSRAVVGTALVLALVAVFSLAVGTILRRSAAAITAVIVLIVLPQMVAGALPLTAAQWLMRLTPAAGLSIQQTAPRYEHVAGICLPESGCFVDGPWVGVGVLCGYVAVAVAVAYWLLRRRDA